jgi:anhydro-N-acetylmuramic acid kinase
MVSAIGLNSGSSFDSIDAVLIDIEIGWDGLPVRPTFKAGRSYAWPATIAGDVLRAFENKLTIFELCRLNYAVGAVYAECARSLMRELGLSPGDVEVIGYDGQTIYQEPADHTRLSQFLGSEDLLSRWLGGPYPCGLQIGEPAIVATECDTTVCNAVPTLRACVRWIWRTVDAVFGFYRVQGHWPGAYVKHRRHSKLSISGSRSCPDDGF